MSVIKINPAVLNDKRDATATAWNEGLRLWMEDNNFDPQFEFTPEQQTFFAKTAYSQDAAAMRKTIVARIATRDTSVPSATNKQISETMRLLQEVGDSIGKFHKDAGVVKALMQDLQTRAPAPEQAAEAPVTEGTEQMAQGAGDVTESPAPQPAPKPIVKPAVQPDPARMDAYRLASAAARNAVKVVDGDKDPKYAERAYRLLLGTSATESAHGTHKDTNKRDNNIGQFQIGMDTFETQMSRIRKDPAMKQRIKDAGMDPDKWTYEDVLKPGVAAIIARLEYKKAKPAIPESDAEQAAYWKKYYNTSSNKKITPEAFKTKLAERVRDERAWDEYEKSLKKK